VFPRAERMATLIDAAEATPTPARSDTTHAIDENERIYKLVLAPETKSHRI
jgi:hypothetical protein